MKKNSDFLNVLKDRTIITGGHFMITANGNSLNLGTVKSFKWAVALFCEGRKTYSHLGLGILINDIGAVCTADACSTVSTASREDFKLPNAYLAILEDAGLYEKDLHLFWEKHMRNRGKKWLISKLSLDKEHFSYVNGEYIYQEQENLPIILTRKSAGDKYGTPACPLIMSAYTLEHKRMGYHASLNFYYVGEDNYLNIANHYVIEKGKYIIQKFGYNFDIKNIYIFNDAIMQNFPEKLRYT